MTTYQEAYKNAKSESEIIFKTIKRLKVLLRKITKVLGVDRLAEQKSTLENFFLFYIFVVQTYKN